MRVEYIVVEKNGAHNNMFHNATPVETVVFLEQKAR